MILPGDVDLGLALAVWRRNVAVYRHTWRTNILPNFFEPMLYLVGMGIGLGGYLTGGRDPESYVAFIGPGLMAASAMNGASFETTYNMFVKMHFAKLYDAYLSTPAQLQDVAFGEALFAVSRALLYGIGFLVVLGSLTLAGYPILTSWGALLLPFAMVLVGALFAAIGQTFTASVRTIEMYSYYYTLFLTPLFLFSGIFFPVSQFPHGETVSWFTPLYHGVRLCRGLAQGPLGVEHLVSAVWLLVAAGALGLLVPRLMRRRMLALRG